MSKYPVSLASEAGYEPFKKMSKFMSFRYTDEIMHTFDLNFNENERV